MRIRYLDEETLEDKVVRIENVKSVQCDDLENLFILDENGRPVVTVGIGVKEQKSGKDGRFVTLTFSDGTSVPGLSLLNGVVTVRPRSA